MRFNDSKGDFDRVDPNMTSMIDVCFMLLIFFIANMRILFPEGDFNIKMPNSASAESKGSDNDVEMPRIMVRLKADRDGNLVGIQMGERKLDSIKELRRLIREIADLNKDAAGPSTEVEIDCDYNLTFDHAMEALTAICGYVADDKQTIVNTIDNVRFSPPRKPNS